MELLCTLKNMTLSFGTKEIFNQANIQIYNQDKVGLLGLNGMGKSSLFKVLSGEVTPDNSIPPFQFDKSKGETNKEFSVFLIPQEIALDHLDISIEDFIYTFYPELKKINNDIKAIEHQMSTDFDNIDQLIEKQTEAYEKFEHLHGNRIIQNYESYLRYFGHEQLDLKIRDLSGGEQKKLLLSAGFSSVANLILWDEPTNHLDLETIKLFEDELKQFQRAYLIISHDRYLLSKLCKKIFHIKLGQIEKFEGSYSDYLEHLETQEAERLKRVDKLKNGLRRETDWMRQGVKARRTRSKKRVEGYLDLKKDLANLKSQAKKSIEISISHSNRKTKVLTKAIEAEFSYPGKKPLFKGINLELYKGDKVGLMGQNGVGKTTLIQLLAGKLAATKGQIKMADDVKIQIFSQKREELLPDMTPYDLLGDGTDYVILPNGSQLHVSAYFERFLFRKQELHRPIKTFSGGEKNRLVMAFNLLKNADLWVFDEPTNDLDLETIQILEEKLAEFKGALILISHDRAFLSNITNKIWLLQNKQIESFDSGYSQAKAYLDVVTMENLLDGPEEQFDEQVDKESSQTLQNPIESELIKEELSNAQLDKIQKEIQDVELKIEEIKKVQSQFDFSKELEGDMHQVYGKLSKKIEGLEEILLGLYEKIE